LKRRFVFVKKIETLVSQGLTDLQVPEGTRFSPLAADLIREKGIRISFSNDLRVDSAPPPLEKEKRSATSSKATPEEIPAETSRALIAVASEGKDSTADVGLIAARSRYFLIFNRRGELIETLENPHRKTGSGAGREVADFLAGRGVVTFVAQKFGVNIKASIERRGMKHTESSGPAAEAVKALLKRGWNST
jgi:predicted Fe-Mo cluster-binding NifX family protein